MMMDAETAGEPINLLTLDVKGGILGKKLSQMVMVAEFLGLRNLGSYGAGPAGNDFWKPRWL